VLKMKGSAHKNRANFSMVLPGLPQRCGGGGGGETPFELESPEDDEKDEDEREIIFPHSPHLENLPSPSELCGRQMGDPTSGRQVRRPRVEADGVCSLLS
jgi:hypothetical protein